MMLMPDLEHFKIVTFYEFTDLSRRGILTRLKNEVRSLLREYNIKGTVILAEEGFNCTICGKPGSVELFIRGFEALFETKLKLKESHHHTGPFRRAEVKIRPEIVTLKQKVNMELGAATHIGAAEWNSIITDAETIVLDARNDYECKTGTFAGAINPRTRRFSDLPTFVQENLDPSQHKKVAMFCTGGIRCEKFVPFMKRLGFKEVYQLDGGVLKYLAEVRDDENLWEGECFVFDQRISVDSEMRKGAAPDHSNKAAE